MAGVTVTGIDRVRSDLLGTAKAAANLEHILGMQARRTAEAIADVPHRSGRLAKGVKAAENRRVTRSSFEIGVGTFYGHMVFKGTSHSPAEPPKIPGDVGRKTAAAAADYIVRHRHGLA